MMDRNDDIHREIETLRSRLRALECRQRRQIVALAVCGAALIVGMVANAIAAAPPGVVAPFTVHGRDGQTIFEVKEVGADTLVRAVARQGTSAQIGIEAPGGALIARMAGKTTGSEIDAYGSVPDHADAAIGSALGGGYVIAARTGDWDNAVVIGASKDERGVVVRKNGKAKVKLGLNPAGIAFVSIFGSGTKPAAGLQTYDDGKGEVAVFNEGGDPVASLSRSSTGGGGNIKISDPSGNGVFSAGYNPADDADVCLDRKKRLVCMGVNLPLSASH